MNPGRCAEFDFSANSRLSLPSHGRRAAVPLLPSFLGYLWAMVAAFVPIYRILPAGAADAWTYSVYTLILGGVVLGVVSIPRWPVVWLFAAYAALVASFVSRGDAPLSSSAYVGIQLIVLLGFGPFALKGVIDSSPKVVPKAMVLFVIAQSASSFVAVLQILGFDVLGWSMTQGRAPGLAGHPNVAGIMAALAILILCAALIRRKLAPLIAILLLACNVIGIMMTGSLSAMFACLLGVLVLSYSAGHHRVRLTLILSAVMVAAFWILSIPAVAATLRNPLDRFMQVTGRTEYISTLDIRGQTYGTAFSAIREQPFLGVGLGSESSAAIGEGTVVHNIFLRAWYQGGLLLGLAIGFILLAILILTIRAVALRQHALAVGILVVMLSYALTSAFFEQAYYWLPVLAAWATMPRSVNPASGASAVGASTSPLG